ncbi:MAG TPA: methyl-accepting chemotaxis protein [bacterium]|nr:methyl-accepting chemotaxis protein [bacterium]HMZ05785.1 methyl-accepting chemotaxis protein [bacterium]HNH30163.1 methyl-accepting chemotaxis protein [bacterium]
MIFSSFKKRLESLTVRYFADSYISTKIGYILVPIFAWAYAAMIPFSERAISRETLIVALTISFLVWVMLLALIQRRLIRHARHAVHRFLGGQSVSFDDAQGAVHELLRFPGRNTWTELVLFILVAIVPFTLIFPQSTAMLSGMGIGTMYAALFNYILTERWAAALILFIREHRKNLQIADTASHRMSRLYVTVASVSVISVGISVWFIIDAYNEYLRSFTIDHFPTTAAMHAFLSQQTVQLQHSLLIAVGMMTACTFGIVIILSVSLDGVLRDLSKEIRKLEVGDFSGSKKYRTPHGMGFLLIQLDSAVHKIRDRINYLQRNGVDMYTTTNKIAAISSDQNQSLVRQSSSLSETSSTLEEMVRSSNQIADHASAVVGQAEDTERSAKKGVLRMEETVRMIKNVESKNQLSLTEVIQLSESIQEIEQILRFINSVADETNLIALNATIEASSAGEHGKRFKVVANEVRSLSDRVTSSVKNIQRMIDQVQEATTRLVTVAQETSEHTISSADMAQQTLTNLKEILEWAQRSSDAAKQIYISINQQRLANRQISFSFNDISADMRALAASSERYAETVDALKKFSNNMEAVVKYFVKQQHSEKPDHEKNTT